jgi:hypothetical protein
MPNPPITIPQNATAYLRMRIISLRRAPVVGVQAIKPIQLAAYGFIGIVFRIDVFRAESRFHGIDEHGRIIVAPFLEVRDVEGYEHIVVFMNEVVTVEHASPC